MATDEDRDEGKHSTAGKMQLNRSQLVSQRTIDWTSRKTPGSSVGEALTKGVKAPSAVHVGIRANKITSYGKTKGRVLTVSNDFYALFVTHGKVSSEKGLLSGVASTLKTPFWTRKGWSQREKYVRYIDVADIDYIQTGVVGTYKLERARGSNKKRLKGIDSRIDKKTDQIVTIVHHGKRTLDLLVDNQSDRTALIECLKDMMRVYREAQQHVGNEELLLRYIWYDIDTTNDGLIQQQEFILMTRRINLYLKNPAKIYKNYLKGLKEEKTNQTKDGLSYHESMCLLQRIKSGRYGSTGGEGTMEVAKSLTKSASKTVAKTVTKTTTKSKKEKKEGPKLPAMEIWDAIFGPEKTHVSDKEFLDVFLVQNQKESDANIKHVQNLMKTINRMELNREEEEIRPKHMSKIRFESYLMSAMNDAYNPRAQEFDQSTLNEPMSHYWINTSHNTYLMGDQLRSTSSVSMYMESLRRGCKCLELDCWDGEKTIWKQPVPVVFHGHTLTSKIVFGDIIKGVKSYVDSNPDTYPIILSLENHCSHPFQEEMAKILKETLGDLLYTPFEDPSMKAFEVLPSPETLRGKVIIKGKRPPESEEEEEDEDDEEDPYEEDGDNGTSKKEADKPKPPKIVKELARMTLFHGTHYKSFDKSIELPPSHMHSIGETKISKILSKDKENGEKWRKYNVRHLTRTYPGGARVDSSNYNPIVAWSMGCQLVALNFQTSDSPLLLNDGRFRQNGGCGYVLKPKSIMGYNNMSNAAPTVVTVKVLSGSCLPKPQGAKEGETIDPYVQVSVHDVATDEKTGTETYATDSFTTSSVNDNGFCPIWSDADSKPNHQFTIHNMDSAMIQFSLWEEDVDFDDKVADATIPMSCLRKGVRSIQLYDQNGTRTGAFGFAALLVEIDY